MTWWQVLAVATGVVVGVLCTLLWFLWFMTKDGGIWR